MYVLRVLASVKFRKFSIYDYLADMCLIAAGLMVATGGACWIGSVSAAVVSGVLRGLAEKSEW